MSTAAEPLVHRQRHARIGIRRQYHLEISAIECSNISSWNPISSSPAYKPDQYYRARNREYFVGFNVGRGPIVSIIPCNNVTTPNLQA